MATRKPEDKIKRMNKYAKITPHPFHDKVELTTKLVKKDKIVLISFKKMELSIVESELNGKPKIKEHKVYILGDIGLFTYCTRVRQYEAKGYDIENETSNLEDILKKWKP
jgi:hypothetical protein